MKHCVAKLEKLYDQCKKLQKNATSSASSTQHQKAKYFKSILYNLFNKAHKQFNYSGEKKDVWLHGKRRFQIQNNKREKRPKAKMPDMKIQGKL